MSTAAINKAPAAANVNANVGTVQIFPQASNLLLACILTGPGGGQLEQKKFWVRASGYITSAGNFTALIGLYSGTSLVAGNNTLIGASSARTVNTTSCPWSYEAALTFDSVSGKLQGTFKAIINNVLDAEAALAAVVTGVSGGVGSAGPALNFVIGITFGTANAGNLASLADFALDA